MNVPGREVTPEPTSQPARWRWFDVVLVLLVAAVVALVMLPSRISSHDPEANEIADRANLLAQYDWLRDYRRRHGGLPAEGGFRFVLANWTAGVCEHTRWNLLRFFTPGPSSYNDLRFDEMMKMVARGEGPLPRLADTTSVDTGYVGLAAERPRGDEAWAPGVAWMADDNEGASSLRTGAITVLFGDGAVRTFAYDELAARFGLGPFDRDAPVATWGPAAVIPACRGLSNLSR